MLHWLDLMQTACLPVLATSPAARAPGARGLIGMGNGALLQLVLQQYPPSLPSLQGHAAAASPDSADRSNGDASHVIERRLSDVLGLSMPKLSVSEVHSPAASPAPATARSDGAGSSRWWPGGSCTR